MIYDCFTFYNELDLLEIRLNTLNDYVDKFVLVEADRNQHNKPKELCYEINKSRYEKFKDKIIHVVVDDYPEKIQTWTIENHQRNCIERGLANCKDDDIIIISDLDEIPNPEILVKYLNTPGIAAFDMFLFKFYLNNFLYSNNWKHGSKMLSYKDFKNILDNDDFNSCNFDTRALIPELNEGTTASKIRLYYGKKQIHIKDSGWHFTWVGNKDFITNKMQAVCESDFYEGKSVEEIIKGLGRELYIPVVVDGSFPEYIRQNQDKYADMLLPDASRTISQLAFIHKITRPLKILKIIAWFIPVKKIRRNIYRILGI
ncbi:MAG: hypothetical protein LBK53_02740 [Heliobacteriaceae bacterium]|jgi:beta-1,4-mannosyl-glycoprotein beta-1,4-N-acetylglucosaminyltransferase|nr:hypothetical protein [Heliobacteriaceae bacterium]